MDEELVLTLYLLHELSKGHRSSLSAWLRMLPTLEGLPGAFACALSVNISLVATTKHGKCFRGATSVASGVKDDTTTSNDPDMDNTTMTSKIIELRRVHAVLFPMLTNRCPGCVTKQYVPSVMRGFISLNCI